MLKQVKDRVKLYLEHFPETRDCDNILIAKMLKKECLNKGIFDIHAFFERYAIGEFSSAESIRRSRQKWQEKIPDLRGKSYYQRKHKQQGVIQELKEM